MKQTFTIKEMQEQERPYEKCLRFGAASLTDIELLAIFLRSGTKGKTSLDLAKQILFDEYKPKGLLSLHHWSTEELMTLRGVGQVKSVQMLCLCELAKRLARETRSTGVSFESANSIAAYYMEDMRHLEQEVIKLLMLNTKSRLVGVADVSKGTVNASVITPRELFIEALQKNAVSIILMHNHPSGDPEPSKADILLTKRIQEAGMLIGIDLLDHIVIGDRCYFSFNEHSMM